MSLFIVFEGIDGSGKTTQIELLRQTLVANGHDPLVTEEPDGTPLGEAAGRWLRGYPNLSPLTELLLFQAARTEHVEKVIRPTLKAGRTVLCDRFTASTIAYQSYGRGLDLEMVEDLNRLATGGLQPTLTIFLDLPVEAARSRKDLNALDNFERPEKEFRQRVRQGYQTLAANNPKTWLTIDATLPKTTIAQKIHPHLPLTSSPLMETFA